MIFGLDYDGTYTEDPETFDKLIALLQGAGHQVVVVTTRYDNYKEGTELRTALTGKVNAVYFTQRKAKLDFMQQKGIKIHVWIDDNPHWLLHDALM